MLDYADSDLDLDDSDDDDLNAIESLLSDLGEDDDYSERKKKRRGGAARRGNAPAGTGKGLYKQPASKEYVTQAQLRSSLGEVTKNFEKTAAGVKKLDADVAAIAARLGKIDDVNAGQTKALGRLKKDNDKTKEFFLMMSLLGGPKSLKASETFTAGGTTFAKDDEFKLVPAGDKMDKLLPLLLLGGMGGGNGNGSSGGMFDNPLMMILLMDGLGSGS